MSYARIIDNVIQSEGELPRSARRLDTQEWVLGLPDAPIELQQACGFYVILDTERPINTITHTQDRSLVLLTGVPTVIWTQRLKIQDEIDAATAVTTSATLETQAMNALTVNRTFLALVSPTSAQVVAQTRALTRQNNGLIRLLIDRASLVDGAVD